MKQFNSPQNFPDIDWELAHWLRDDSRSPIRLASPVRPEGEGFTLYYPGCGADYSPLVYLSKRLPLKAVVYADYMINISAIQEMIREVCEIDEVLEYPTFQTLNARLFGANNWARFWPENKEAQIFSNPRKGRGIQCNLALSSGPLKFIFLRTEGHQTYINLLGTELQPDIVVLQEHGFGGNWRNFGGPSAMYAAAAMSDRLPRWLYVADNTTPWPGYRQAEAFSVQAGQMHAHERAIFERKKERPDSLYR